MERVFKIVAPNSIDIKPCNYLQIQNKAIMVEYKLNNYA